MGKFRFHIIVAALAFAAYAHGASHPQASQEWVKDYVRTYVASNTAATQLTVVHTNNVTRYSLGGKSITIEDSTAKAIVIGSATAAATAAGLTDRKIFAYDTAASSENLGFYRAGDMLICADEECFFYPGPVKANAIFVSDSSSGMTLLYPVGSTNSNPVCELLGTKIQPTRAARILSGED